MSYLDKFVPQRLGKERLISIFEKIAKKSGCIIVRNNDIEDIGSFLCFSVTTVDGNVFKIHIDIKNISGAGWSDKPEIKRIQIRKLPEIPRQRKNEFYILAGIANYDSTSVLAVWDPMNYTTHNTVCSCYVYISSLEKAKTSDLFFGLNKGKEVMTCSENGFEKLIKEISSRYM